MPALTEPIPIHSPARCGGKAARLLDLQAAGFQVPAFLLSPDDLPLAIKQLGTPLAVRSSASLEDGHTHSFAGQFRSFLNLNTLDEVQQAVRSCRESVNDPAVVEYCRKSGLNPESIQVEVIVQRMIAPELAGVAFTVNPITGKEEVTLECCAGVADQLLAGQTDALPPDHALVVRHRAEIETTARRIARHFGAPQDIEFAIEDGKLYILQARPITRIAFAAEVGEWTNADFRDGGVSSGVCSPLMWSLYEFVWDRSLKETLRELRLFQGEFIAGRSFFGRPYWNLGAVKEALATLPGFVEREFDEDLSVRIQYEGDGRRTPVTPATVMRAIPTLLSLRRFFRRQQLVAEQTLAQKCRDVTSRYDPIPDDVESAFRHLVERDYLQLEYNYFRTIFAASLAKLDFLGSFPSADYSALVAALPPLRHMAPVRDVQTMPARTDDRLGEVIGRYRHHCRLGLDILFPRWDEDQTFVTRMLASLPDSAGDDPRPAYEAARAEALSRLPWWRRRAFNVKLDRLRRFVWLREEMRDLSSQMYYVIRRYSLKIAQRRGLGDDLFFSTFKEILADDRSSIERNREVYDSYRAFKAPNEIGTRYTLDTQPRSGALTGIGASPGTIEAAAFVAHSVEQAAQMPAGQILVCPFTDPGWTPILDRAAGVVTETGGLLSHAAIICREFGIPAVLGVVDATSRIRQGRRLVIHGGQGRVEFSSNALNEGESE